MARISFSGSVRRSSLLATSVLLAAFCPAAGGQETKDASAAPEDKPPRFTVELIVFTYSDEADAGSEIFVPDPPPVDEYLQADSERSTDAEYVFSDVPREAADQAGSAAGEPAQPGSAPGEAVPADDAEITGIDTNPADVPLRARIELHLLEPEQYTMDDIYQELVALDAYQPIMRAAWTQTTPPEEASPAIQLRALGDPPPGLDGTVKLYQGRFVHLGIDLALAAEGDGISPYSEQRAATDRAIAYGDPSAGRGAQNAESNREDSAYEDVLPGPRVYSDRDYENRSHTGSGGFFSQPVRYRISEVRIMRDGEIRYYDHPRFGVIAKLTEVPAEKSGIATSEENTLAGTN